MDFSKISIKQIIPQRPPFLMIDKVIRCEDCDAYLEFFVTPDNVLTENYALSAYGLIENMAQSCAAFIGCECLLRGVPITVGYIGEVRNAKICEHPRCGQTIKTHVHVIEDFFNIVMAEVEVKNGDKCVATAYVKVAKTNIIANLKD